MNYPIFGQMYRHYKGGQYEFLFLAPHTETKEILVIYKSLLFGSYHARPLDEWNKDVDSTTKRFTLIK
jgi:hypothetical protein